MTTLWILFGLMNLGTFLKTGNCVEVHDQVLAITPKTQEQVEVLKNVSSEDESALWKPESRHYIREESEVRLFVPATNLEAVKDLLQRHNITHEVLVANTRALIEMQMDDSTDVQRSSNFYERYHKLEEIYDWINRTAQDHPAIIKTILIGSSSENRPLYVLKLSMNNREDKKAMWIDCGIHAREWISPAFCLWFVQHSLTSYNVSRDITDILDNMDVYILPVMNPDGYSYTWTTNRNWRSNRSVHNGSSCIGVDLNRNFNSSWCSTGVVSHDPCDNTYCGAFPESEPESKAVADFLRSHKDTVQLYISIHAFSQMLLFPYSYKKEHAENHNDLLEMAQEAAQKIKNIYENNYKYGQGATTIYLAPGGSDDWAYDLGIKYAFTFELQDKERGHYGFLLPPSLIPTACNEALTAVTTVALKVVEKTQALRSHPASL
ncbi:carboxypeptidase B2-like [Cheilinus undulatus]|uniref:carboxypeptidase B2-like n=1 Tax=Cheilinus undulatus TaxID=241271 RepID=UPI001BD447A6|nr:carboxypeptidase B2-like [Cheilinus undulatus]